MTQKPDFQFDPSLYHARAEVQIRFNDIDILGHLNNVQYFSLFDTAKAQYLQQVMRGDIDCDFIASAYYGEPIEIYTRCIKLGKRAFTLEQVMVNASNMQVKAVCRTVMVSYDPDLGVTVEISDRARDGINALERNQCRI